MPFTSTSNSGTTAFVAPRANTKMLEADELLIKDDIMRQLNPNYAEGSLLDMLTFTNREVLSTSPYFFHYEPNLLFRSVKIATVIGGGTATEASFTLTADSHTNKGGYNYSPLQATDILWVGDGQWAYVTNKTSVSPSVGSAMIPTGELAGSPNGTGTVYTVRTPVGATWNVNTVLTALAAAGTPVAIPSNAHAEGSFQPLEGVMRDSTKYQGQMQILKGHTEVTGTADGTQLNAEIGGTTYIWNQMTADNLMKFKAQVNYTFLYSPGGSVLNAKGEEVRLTTGFDGSIRNQGNNYAYTIVNGFVKSDLDAIVARIKKTLGGKEFYAIGGSVVASGLRQIAKDEAQEFVRFGTWGESNPQQRKLDLGIDSMVYQGITFHMMEMALHPEVDAIAMYNLESSMYLIPASEQRIQVRDTSGQSRGLNVPSAAIRYLKQSGGENRRFKQLTSNFENGNTNGRDVSSYDVLAEAGLQLVAASKMFRIYGA